MNVLYTLSTSAGCRVKGQSRSFVKAFLQIFYAMTANLSDSIIDIDNTSRAVDGNAEASLRVVHSGLDARDDAYDKLYDGGQGATTATFIASDDCGIVVGTGSTAVAVADDNLVTPIAQGLGSGQLVHYGCYGLNYTTGASSASFDVERIFRNGSGGSIIVAEIGMYCRARYALSGGQSSLAGFCILRDVLGATVTVLDGEYLKVKYTITVSN